MSWWFLFFTVSVSSQQCETVNQRFKNDLLLLKKFIVRHEGLKALKLSDSLIQINANQGTEDCKVNLNINLYKGEAFELTDNFSAALDLYYDLIRKCEKLNDWEMVAQSYISIARCHEFLERPDDCLRNLNLALELIRQHQLKKLESRYAVRYSSYNRLFGSLDTALYYAQKAIDLGARDSVPRSQVDGYLLMGIIKKTDLNKSIYYLQKACEIFKNSEDFAGAASMYTNLAKRFKSQNQLNKMVEMVDSASVFAQKVDTSSSEFYYIDAEISKLKAFGFKQKNNIDSVYFYLDKARTMESNFLNLNRNEAIEQKAVEFAIEKEKAKNEVYRRMINLQTAGVLGLSGLLLVLIGLYISNRSKRVKIENQNEIIRDRNNSLNQYIQQQTTLLSEVHHRVKNNLQLVISLLTLHKTKIENPESKEILDDLSGKVRSIALIHEQLYTQEKFDTLDLPQYIKNLGAYFHQLISENERVIFNFEIEDIFLNMETAFPIGIICTELVGNSFKYAKKPDKPLKISIKCSKYEKSYVLCYRDNGPGYADSFSKKQSMGITLINNMVRQLQATSKFYNDKGAVFSMTFKEKIISVI